LHKKGNPYSLNPVQNLIRDAEIINDLIGTQTNEPLRRLKSTKNLPWLTA